MRITRRELIFIGVGSALGWAFSKLPSLRNNSKIAADVPHYKIFGLGMEGQRFPGGQIYKEHSETVLTELDLVTGAIKQTLLPMPNGHIVTILPNGHLVCTPIQGPKIFVLNQAHEVLKVIDNEPGLIFGGHGLHVPDLNMILVSVKAEDPNKSGYLAAYDDKTFELKKKLELGSLYPHDLRLVPGSSSKVVVSHGSQAQSFQGTHLGKDPVATIIDASTGEILNRYSDFELKGLNHVAISANGDIFTSQLVSLPASEDSVQKFENDFPGIKWAWGDGTGSKLDRLPYPAPILWFPRQGKSKALMASPGQFLRHQDITYHDSLDCVYSTYSESNSIAVANSKGHIETLSASLFGIHKVRGIRTLPDSNLAVINDSENGMALVDMKTRKLVRFYEVSLFLTRHVALQKI